MILYAEDKFINRIYKFSNADTKDLSISSVDSYEAVVKKAVEIRADIIIIQLLHPIFKIQNLFHDLLCSGIVSTLFIFNIVAENQIICSLTNHQDSQYINKIKQFFSQALSKDYHCYFTNMDNQEESNLIMTARINRLEKDEYLHEILRGVTNREFQYYKRKVNLNLNNNGYYLYMYDIMEIEYSDHNLNKSVYNFTGNEIIKEFQAVIDAYSGGEVFYVNPLQLYIIINDLKVVSQARKENILFDITSRLNKIANCKTSFRYMSDYIKGIENIRTAYESLHDLKAYSFFCRDAKLITSKYLHSIRQEIDYKLIDKILREIKELIKYDLLNTNLNGLIKKLFLDIVKPSLDYDLYYYCYTALSTALADKYNDTYNKRKPENLPPTKLLFTSIEQECHKFIESLDSLRFELSNKLTVTNSIVMEAIEFIHAHYMENITLNEISAKLNVSHSYLSQIVKKELGISIIKYIIAYRIENAKTFLSSSNEPIYTIAAKVGFFEERHFSKTFKKITGLTPTQYKKKNSKVTYI
ncbi:helix-turn-helix domain-containing protein [Pelorhabdus rhamnosifermentans]|uniref:helix-turn-helix domain-containing protein n=1 Tax=Pelorhabdus rhamnosifermentans TaxID=2772457 RepID=UPI0028A7DF48|nr:AraC family transcriptional regulator [Pelorhabdus rhamnosifermentans]